MDESTGAGSFVRDQLEALLQVRYSLGCLFLAPFLHSTLNASGLPCRAALWKACVSASPSPRPRLCAWWLWSSHRPGSAPERAWPEHLENRLSELQ